MDIKKELKDGELTIELSGRLDTTTSPELEKELKNSVVDDIKKLVFDFSTLEYISSAGLRVLLAAQKVMNKQGEMIILNASSDIMEVFDITGFSDILTIK